MKSARAGSELEPQVRLDDPNAFEHFIRQHERSLRQFAYRLLGSREAMEDALQEACLRAYRGLSTFQPRGSDAARAWLFQIVHRTCIDHIRRMRYDAVRFDDALEHSTEPDPVDEIAERSQLAVALAQLPVDLRSSVLLVDLIGFDYATAATLLGVPAGTLASRLHRARALLRRALMNQGTELIGGAK